MTWYFDKANNGFKLSDVHGDLSSDPDCIELTDAHYAELQAKEANGIAGYIVDENGFVDVIELGLDKTILFKQMEKDVQKYLYSKYDNGTQMTLQAMYSDPDSTEELKASIKTIWGWIKTVLQYYFTKRAYLDSCEDLTGFSYDFQQFDASKPDITLEGLMNAI